MPARVLTSEELVKLSGRNTDLCDLDYYKTEQQQLNGKRYRLSSLYHHTDNYPLTDDRWILIQRQAIELISEVSNFMESGDTFIPRSVYKENSTFTEIHRDRVAAFQDQLDDCWNLCIEALKLERPAAGE